MFEFIPHFSYTDFDECQPFKSSCHFDAECINTEGSYDCRCRPGYLGDGFDCACKFSWYYRFAKWQKSLNCTQSSPCKHLTMNGYSDKAIHQLLLCLHHLREIDRQWQLQYPFRILQIKIYITIRNRTDRRGVTVTLRSWVRRPSA